MKETLGRNLIVSVGVLLFAASLLTLAAPLASTRAFSSPPPIIRLRFATFDPLAGEPYVPAEPRSTASESGAAIWLVQFVGPVRDEWKVGVEQVGARLYGYIPDYAFVARMDGATAEMVRALPFVRWLGLYHPTYRLAPSLSAQSVGSSAQPVPVSIQTLPDVDLRDFAREVESLGGKVQGSGANDIAGYVRASIAGSHLAELAAMDGVLWVEPYFRAQLFNDVGGGQIMRANDVRQNLGLYGSGQIVGVADTGLDVGTLGPAMSDDFEGRIVEGQAICAYFQGGRKTWNDFDGHGTHTAGSVLGNGVLSGSDPSHHSYSGSFAGVAPEARLVFQSIDHQPGGGLECVPSDLITYLFKPAYDKGARVHSNSWGGPTGGTQLRPQYGGYDTEAQQVDAMMWQYKDMLILYSAGNSGEDKDRDGVVDPDSIGSPGTAKDVVTVGASENNRSSGGYNPGGPCGTWRECWPTSFPVAPIAGDALSNNPSGMAAFSSRGPTDDGRIKPDIVAPGTNIISARSHDPDAGTGWGVYDGNYIYEGGTSMSAPLTAGAVALVREWLTRIKGVNDPSAALMKAVLLNGAADMSPGQYGTGATLEVPAQRPNNVTGWGRVDLVESLNPPLPRKVWFKEHNSGLSTGGTAVYTLTIGSAESQADEVGKEQGNRVSRLVTLLPGGPRPFVGNNGVQPVGTSQLLQNPGLESGNWSPWETYGSPYLTSVIQHGGSWSAHLGLSVPGNADDEFWQQVDIPSDATAVTLDFWYRLRTKETAANTDYFCYGIWDQTGTTAFLLRCADFGKFGDVDWTKETYNLSSSELAQVMGQTVLMGFYVTTDFWLASQAWVDDTALTVTTSGATPAPSPTPTVTPAPQTPTPSPTPGACPDAVQDGGFEQATADTSHPQWNVADNARFTVGESIARTGQNAAILGYTSGPPSTGDLWQAVNVPAGTASSTLSFWYQAMGDGAFTVDVDVMNSSGSTALVHLATLTTAGFVWQQYSHTFTSNELASLAGKSTRLRFHVQGVTDPEDVVVDDVSWGICAAGGTPTPTVTPVSTGGTFRIILAWTDYPGEPAAAKALVNDLDMEVIGPDGTHYYGNQGAYTGGQCLRGGKWDACNTVEGVILPNAAYGTYRVVVHGVNVPKGPQAFALVASGDGLREGSGLPSGGQRKVHLPLVVK